MKFKHCAIAAATLICLLNQSTSLADNIKGVGSELDGGGVINDYKILSFVRDENNVVGTIWLNFTLINKPEQESHLEVNFFDTASGKRMPPSYVDVQANLVHLVMPAASMEAIIKFLERQVQNPGSKDATKAQLSFLYDNSDHKTIQTMTERLFLRGEALK